MNRREFCLSLGAVALGSTMTGWGHHCAAVKAVTTDSNDVFRAKMIYFEHWRDQFDFPTVLDPLRNELTVLAEEYDALVVEHRQSLPPRFVDVLEAETLRLGLELFFPATFPVDVDGINSSRTQIREVQTANDSHIGLLFDHPDLRGIIVCDTSRCRWRTFLCRSNDTPGKMFARSTNLKTAQWLDTIHSTTPIKGSVCQKGAMCDVFPHPNGVQQRSRG